jgi:hypothetical protein
MTTLEDLQALPKVGAAWKSGTHCDRARCSQTATSKHMHCMQAPETSKQHVLLGRRSTTRLHHNSTIASMQQLERQPQLRLRRSGCPARGRVSWRGG